MPPTDRRAIFFVIGGLVISPLSSAAYEFETAPDPSKIYKILPKNFSIECIPIEAPPTDNIKEAEYLFEIKQLRTEERIREIISQNINPIPLFWDCAGVSEIQYPEFASHFYNVLSDVEIVVLALKKKFSRQRPSVVLPAIDPVVPVPWHFSYPSGHATQSIVLAELLSGLRPEAAERLQKLAFRVGVNREVAGLHYPTDTIAGFTLGRWFLNQFSRFR